MNGCDVTITSALRTGTESTGAEIPFGPTTAGEEDLVTSTIVGASPVKLVPAGPVPVGSWYSVPGEVAEVLLAYFVVFGLASPRLPSLGGGVSGAIALYTS